MTDWWLQMNSLGPSMSALSPITLVLGDSCLPWEEMDAVFGIESYLFFPETKAKFGLTSPSMFETRRHNVPDTQHSSMIDWLFVA